MPRDVEHHRVVIGGSDDLGAFAGAWFALDDLHGSTPGVRQSLENLRHFRPMLPDYIQTGPLRQTRPLAGNPPRPASDQTTLVQS